MKREIKFKAYDYDTGKMYHDINVGFTTWGNILIVNYGEFGTSTMLTNAIILQYTGVKDIKGIEVFEGDIVAIDDGLLCEAVCRNINSGFELYNHSKGWYFETWRAERVIGNVYENPELLRGETR